MRTFFSLIFIIFFTATACIKKKEIINIGILNRPYSLTAWEIRDGASTLIGKQIHRGLLERNPVTGILEGYAAQNWKISKDLKSIEFYLKSNLKFHNETPLTCLDIKESFERILKNSLQFSEKFPPNTTFSCDQNKFVIHVPYIPGNFLTFLASINTSIVKADGITGIGPYKLISSDQKLISLQHTQDDNKWLLFHIENAETLIKEFQEKRIDDLLYLGYFTKLNISCKRVHSLSPSSFWFTMNPAKWAFKFKENRKILKNLIESTLDQSEFFPGEYRIHTLIPWGVLGHNESNTSYKRPSTNTEDYQKIKNLVATYGKIPVTLRLVNKDQIDWVKLFQQIDPHNEIFEVEYIDNETFFQRYYKGELSFFFLGGNIRNDDPFEILNFFKSDDVSKSTNIKRKKIDDLYLSAARSTNIEEIKHLAIEANKWILDNGYAIPLFSKKLEGCLQENIKGVQIGVLGPLQIDYSQVSKK